MGTNPREKNFASYAAENFQHSHSITFENKPLQEPLHEFKAVLDVDAARAISVAILRYTKEGEEPKGAILTKPIFRKLITGLKFGSQDGNFSPYSFIQRWKTTDLEVAQFLCGLGILGPQIRDEIYCQIYKQINGNPSQRVQHMGWSLFACCLSSFSPSNKFYPYMISILKSAPELERSYCRRKLERTLANGDRKEPPSSHEHQAIVNRAFLLVNVRLPNGKSCKLSLDSAATGLEFKKQLKAATGIVDLFGFSFQVSVGREMIVVVSGDDHMMDVISSCEQVAMKLQIRATCRLAFFKEIFSPWHSYVADKVSTELIYNQVISSIKSGEYKIQEESVLGNIIAAHCYLLYGVHVNRNQIYDVIQSFNIMRITNSTSKCKEPHWIQLVEVTFQKKFRQKARVDRIRAAGEVVQYAKLNQAEHFSRIFRCATSSDSSNLTLAINCVGVRLHSAQSNVLWKITFPEIKAVAFEKVQNEKMGSVVIKTVYKEQTEIKADKAESIHELLNFFLTGLRKRSLYILALQDRSQSSRRNGLLDFASGDLIVLDKACSGETIEVTGRGYGTCERTGSVGEVSGGVFYIIPTIEAPNDALLAALRESEVKPKQQQKVNSSQPAPPQTEICFESNTEQAKHVDLQEMNANGTLLYDTRRTEAIVGKASSISRAYDSNASVEQISRYVAPEDESPLTYSIDRPMISKQFYQELEFELSKSKAYVSSEVAMEMDRKSSSSGQDDAENKDSSDGQSVSLDTGDLAPDITILAEDVESSDKDEIAATTVVTVHKELSLVAVDQVSVSLENDITEKDSEVDILPERNEQHHTIEDSTEDTSFKYFEWNPERYGFPSFEECDSYKAIMTYINQPAGDIMSEMKLTDSIFGKPLANTVPEDHVYREIIKHIETAEDETCIERSWELLWLITGLYACSDNIRDEVIGFLRSRTEDNVMAKQCYMRLVKMITHGRRTYPPHIAEVQAIQSRMDLINHKIFFPDGSCQSFEVESSTTARHLISVITENIGLRYPNGCGLFFKIGDKVFGAADEYFFFDFIQHYIEVWRGTEGGDNISIDYQVFFLRKVWINVIPGEDRVADCRLHYYQELSKYLRGYHMCTEDESIVLATLILRAEFGEDTEHLSEIPDMLNKLVPQEVIANKSVDEWQKVIEEALSTNVNGFGDDAKIEFLKELSKRPTFGTAFFHVKSNMGGEIPEILLVAIQKNGLALITVDEKNVIEKYDFSEIEKWSSGEKRMSIQVKVKGGTNTLEFETNLDYQIDDFLTSYISAHGSESREVVLVSDDE